jgi:hypothetical protein
MKLCISFRVYTYFFLCVFFEAPGGFDPYQVLAFIFSSAVVVSTLQVSRDHEISTWFVALVGISFLDFLLP